MPAPPERSPTAILDANVLYAAPVRDLLIRLAMTGTYEAHWTEAIHAEWQRALLQNRPDLSAEQLARTRALMERALPNALVTRPRRRAEAVPLPDPDDRHVLAAAVEAEADLIVTYNLGDFPAEALAPWELKAIHPDAFVGLLLEEASEAVVTAARSQRAALKRPPLTVQEYLGALARCGLTRTAEALRVREAAL